MQSQRTTSAAVGAPALTATALAGLVVARRRRKRRAATSGWQKMSILLPTPPNVLPAPLAEFGDSVETEWATAPGDKGVELAARSRGRKVSPADLRRSLRDCKQLLEVGELLQPDRPGTAQPTLRNLPLRAATRQAKKLGHL